MVDVKILKEEGDYVLVEYFGLDNDLHRASILTDQVTNNQAQIDDLENGIQYGINWEEDYPGLPGLNYEMHRRGIWSYADVRPHIAEAKAAIATVGNKIFSKILEGGK